MTEPREDDLVDPNKQDPGDLPEAETGNDDSDDAAETPSEPTDTGDVEGETE